MVVLTASGSADSFIQFLTVLFLFLFVLLVTYWVTKWTSGLQKVQMTGKNIEIVETVRISNSKYIQIVKTGNKYVVIAVCKDTVTLLTELSEEEFSPIAASEVKSLSFKEIMDKMKRPSESDKDK